MLFDWDAANVGHIARHKVEPEEAEQVVENDPMDAGAVLRNGEARIVHLGETDAGRVLVVVVTERAAVYRVVTAPPADRKERAFYSKHKADTDDQDPAEPSFQERS